MTKLLFICKQRNDFYNAKESLANGSFGLINSSQFVCNSLSQYGIDCKVVSVIDNNYIDREVAQYKPTHVFIEALWVVAEKFDILHKLHPTVKWYIRVHSKVPFLAYEGVAVDWFKKYIKQKDKNVFLTANSIDVVKSFKKALDINVVYLPNIYSPPPYENLNIQIGDKDWIDIGCFGAIRPMKNQLYQAMAAMAFGNKVNKKIRFHINGTRTEQKGDSILKNIENLFEGSDHELVKHQWLTHKDFVNVIKSLDIGMQVSFSETFNIVAADFAWNDIPIIGSKEIEWMSFIYKANPNLIDDMIYKLCIAYYGKYLNLQYTNKIGLNNYNKNAIKVWLNQIGWNFDAFN